MNKIVIKEKNVMGKIINRQIKASLLKIFVTLGIVLLFSFGAAGENWPMRLHDIRRGGVTLEQLNLPLTKAWCLTSLRAPAPAWTESPAKHDFNNGFYDLKPRQNFDRCYDVAVVGDFLYFGSSKSGVVRCLRTDTGREIWAFSTDGPVRFAPHVANGKVYVGSDDGYAYCLNAANGEVIWKESVVVTELGKEDMVWGNEHMISVCPVRSSLLVIGSDVFWTAGQFPEEGVFICKRNAADGTGGWTVSAKLSPQGYILATPDLLFVPTGKTYPTVYRRSNGAYLGIIKTQKRGDGGAWCLLTPDDSYIWTGPTGLNDLFKHSANAGAITTVRRPHLGSVDNANLLIADSTYAYYNTDTKIYKILRSNLSAVWSVSYSYPHTLIKAGDTIFAGGDGEIAAFSESSGTRNWTAAVEGKIYGLAIANGRLYASTDTGGIYCFASNP